jgi:hypothetical protein
MNAIMSNFQTPEIRSETVLELERAESFGRECDPHKLLIERTIKRIRKNLEFSQSELSDKNEAVRVFARDVKKLEQLQHQWNTFVTELAKTHIETTGLDSLPVEKRKSLVGGLQKIINEAKCLPVDDEQLLSAQLLKKEPSEVIAALGTQLGRMIFDMMVEILEKLDLLKSNSILGTLFWADSENCSFDDWRHFISSTSKSETEILASDLRLTRPEENLDATWVKSQTTRERTTFSFLHYAVRTEQHLMQAKQTSIVGHENSIPRQFKSAIEKIPDVLRPEIQFVTGECFVTERTFHTFKDEKWLDSKTKTVVRVHDDPAIVLGNTVLFAWDDIACHRESSEQLADSKKGLAAINFVWALAAMALSVAAFLGLSGFSAGIRALIILPLGLGLYSVDRAFADFAHFRRKKGTFMIRLQILAGWLLVNIGVCLALASLVNFSWLNLTAALFSNTIGVYLLVPAIKPIVWKS